jgi:hypothetical protein
MDAFSVLGVYEDEYTNGIFLTDEKFAKLSFYDKIREAIENSKLNEDQMRSEIAEIKKILNTIDTCAISEWIFLIYDNDTTKIGKTIKYMKSIKDAGWQYGLLVDGEYFTGAELAALDVIFSVSCGRIYGNKMHTIHWRCRKCNPNQPL